MLSLSPTSLVGLALMVATALGVAHCGTSGRSAPNDGADCHLNPQCPAGETCWPASAAAFACLPSDPAQPFGATCLESIGKPTCADGLLCDATNPNGNGTCTNYCGSATMECPAGYACIITSISATGGPTIEICRPSMQMPPIIIDGGLLYDGAFVGDAELSADASASDGAAAQQ